MEHLLLVDPYSLLLIGFSLRSLVGSVAPIAGAFLGGPIGAAIGGAVGARAIGAPVLPGAIMGALAAPTVSTLGQAASTAFTGAGGGLAGVGAGARALGMGAAGLLFGGVSAPPAGGTPADVMPAGGSMGANLVPVGGVRPGGAPAMVNGFADTGGMVMTAGAPLGALGRFGGGAAGAISRMAGNLVIAASGRIRGLMTQGGQFLTAKRVYSGVKVLGIAAASTAIGVGLDQIAAVVLQEATKRGRGRGRGISSRDMRTTRRTTRKLIRFHADLAHLCGQAGATRRRRPIHGRTIEVPVAHVH